MRAVGSFLAALLLAGPAAAQCPSAADYANAAPALHGVYSPYDLRLNAPDPNTDCAGTTPFTPCAVHRVYVPDGTALQPPLLVFLPGSGMEPDKHDLVLQTAAYAGYRAIGLAYANVGTLNSLCTGTTCADDCGRDLHLERVSGIDASPIVDTARGDSILYRLYALLVELHAQDVLDGSNDLHWDEFFVPAPPGASSLNMGAIRWDLVIVAGFSQGGGHASFVAKTNAVSSIVIFDAGGDTCEETPGGTVRAEDWVLNPFNASLDRPHFGTAHTRGEPEPYPTQIVWPLLGFAPIPGEDLDALPLEPVPPSAAFTNQDPAVDIDATCSQHASMAKDGCMPTGATSGAAATSPDAAHLFEPYLLRLCAACAAPGCTTNPASIPIFPLR